MALMMSLRVGESVRIGLATVTLEHKAGQRATLKIDADKSVHVEKISNPITPTVARMGIRSR